MKSSSLTTLLLPLFLSSIASASAHTDSSDLDLSLAARDALAEDYDDLNILYARDDTLRSGMRSGHPRRGRRLRTLQGRSPLSFDDDEAFALDARHASYDGDEELFDLMYAREAEAEAEAEPEAEPEAEADPEALPEPEAQGIGGLGKLFGAVGKGIKHGVHHGHKSHEKNEKKPR